MKKKKVILFSLLAVFVIVGGYFAFKAYDKKSKQKKAAAIGSNFKMVANKSEDNITSTEDNE